MVKTLPRMKLEQIDVDELIQDQRVQLAKDAQSVLGYDRLAKAIVHTGALAYTLRKLNLEPLVRSGVTAYKAKKAKAGMWHCRKVGLIWLAAAMAFLMSLPYQFKNADTNSFSLSIVVAVLSVIFTVVATFIGALYLCEKDYRVVREWKMLSLAGYEGNVPEHVLAKALAIKQENKEVRLYVDQLFATVERAPVPVRDPDPFLFAVWGDETYYIDVWDEKEYEQKL